MSCRIDIETAILDQVFNEVVEDRNTYTREGDNVIVINSKADNSKSKTSNRQAAYKIAQERLDYIKKSFKGQVTGTISETNDYEPIKIKLFVKPEYIEYEYSKLPEEQQTDPKDYLNLEDEGNYTTNEEGDVIIKNEVLGLPGNNIKEGVTQIFEDNPELSKIGTPEQYSQYLDTIFPDSKVTEIDNSLYTSVINQLVQENKLEKDCTGGSKLKAEDGIATLFEKGGKWEIVTDFKNAPTHKSGGKDIYIQGKKVEVEKNELRIENDFGDVAVIPSKYRVEVEDAIKFNCYSCIDGIVEELPKMKDYAGDGTVFPFFGRYKRFKNSLPNNLKNTPEYDYAMRYYWKHNNKPKSFDESINRERPMFTMEDDGYYHAPSVEPNTLRFLKPKNHPTLQYELDWYNSDNPDAVDFRSKYNLDTSDKFYKYVPKKK